MSSWEDTSYTAAEHRLLLEALDKKIWALDHVGIRNNDPRKLSFKLLRVRVQDNLARIVRAEEEGETQ